MKMLETNSQTKPCKNLKGVKSALSLLIHCEKLNIDPFSALLCQTLLFWLILGARGLRGAVCEEEFTFWGNPKGDRLLFLSLRPTTRPQRSCKCVCLFRPT